MTSHFELRIYDYDTLKILIATPIVKNNILMFMSIRSTNYIPKKFIVLATQKKIPLIITEGMDDF